MKAEMTVAQRLRKARTDAGFKSAAAAARHLGVPYGTYSGHESGLRGIKHAELVLYAQAFEVQPMWLHFGDSHTALHETVPFKGSVGKDPEGIVRWFGSDERVSACPVLAPFGKDTQVVMVDGVGARFIAGQGTALYCDLEPRKFDVSLFGEPVIARLTGSDKDMISIVYPGPSEDRYELVTNLQTLRNQALDSVLQIRALIPFRSFSSIMREWASVILEGYGSIIDESPDRDIWRSSAKRS